MTQPSGSHVFLFHFPLLLFNSGGHLKFADGLVTQNNTWFVAKYSGSDSEVMNNILSACYFLSDCKLIKPGGSCFYPDTLLNHASVVISQLYAPKGRHNYYGLIIVTDPSYGSCKYA